MFLSKYVSGFARVRIVQTTYTFATVGCVAIYPFFIWTKSKGFPTTKKKPKPPSPSPTISKASHRRLFVTRNTNTHTNTYKNLMGMADGSSFYTGWRFVCGFHEFRSKLRIKYVCIGSTAVWFTQESSECAHYNRV